MLDRIETRTTPKLIIFAIIPFSFVIHVKYANNGEQNANIVQSIK